MADPIEPTRASFQPFVLSERYVDVVCDEPGYEGFVVNVRMNLSNRERAELERSANDLAESFRADSEKRAAERTKLNELADAARDDGDDAKAKRLLAKLQANLNDSTLQFQEFVAATRRKIAPYVRRWNVYATGPDGEIVEVPAPQVAGPGAFDEIDDAMVNWIVRELLQAYRGGKGFAPLSTNAGARQGRGGEPSSDAPKASRTPSSPASRRSSRSPEA